MRTLYVSSVLPKVREPTLGCAARRVNYVQQTGSGRLLINKQAVRTLVERFSDPVKSSWVAPRFEHAINSLTNRITGVSPTIAAHKKIIVSRMTMADGRNHSGSKGTFLERPPGECPPHPTTAPPGSVFRDRSRFLRRTPWEQSRDRTSHVMMRLRSFFARRTSSRSRCRARCSPSARHSFWRARAQPPNRDALTFVAAP